MTTALSLHAVGIECAVFEQSRAIRELGVGINVLPHAAVARLSATAEIVQHNRSGGPERVIDVVEERAPGGFSNLDEVVSHAEIEAIVTGYAKTTGLDQRT